jgi:hypothetical protein
MDQNGSVKDHYTSRWNKGGLMERKGNGKGTTETECGANASRDKNK